MPPALQIYRMQISKSSFNYLGERHLERDEGGALDAAADRRVSLPPARQRIQTVGGATRIYGGVYGDDARHLRANDSETPLLHDVMIIY